MIKYNVTCLSKNEHQMTMCFKASAKGEKPLTVNVDEVDVYSMAGGVPKVVATAHDIHSLQELFQMEPEFDIELPHPIQVHQDFSPEHDEYLFVERDVSRRCVGWTWTTLCIREDIAQLKVFAEPEKSMERPDDLTSFCGRIEQQAAIGLLRDFQCTKVLATTAEAFRMRNTLKMAREGLRSTTDMDSFDLAAKTARESLQALTELRDFWRTAAIEEIIKKREGM